MDNLERILRIAKILSPLNNQVVYVGGAIVPLLITDPAAPAVRPTKDIDIVVEVASRSEYYELDSRLKNLGFKQPISDDPICRYRLGEILVDFMPTDRKILGFSNRWYTLALQTAEEKKLSRTIVIKLITAPCFIATKLEAFKSRGRNDFQLSHDLEDIIKVIDGREELIIEIGNSDKALIDYLRDTFSSFLRNEQFLESISGYLPFDSANQARLPVVMNVIRSIATS